MTLYIDTTDFNEIVFGVSDGKKIQKKTHKIDSHESHKTLEILEKFLKANNHKLAAISSIVANKGPGSYTGTRVGVTIANALSLALGIPVKFLKKEAFLSTF